MSGRKQRVCLNGAVSPWRDVSSSVPQGSVIGSILSLLYINDLPAVIKSKCKIFADDTKVYHPIVSLIDMELLHKDINSLITWSRDWLLGFNGDKCKVLHIGFKKPCYDYLMKGKKLEVVSKEKDLGVIMSNSMSFSKHVAKAAPRPMVLWE